MEIVDFSGVINVLEDPTFYCGISTLVALPLAVRKENKKKKYWYLAAFAVAGLYFFINPIRFMASGMAGSGSSGSSTFKLDSCLKKHSNKKPYKAIKMHEHKK